MRWKQRYESFEKALHKLIEVVNFLDDEKSKKLDDFSIAVFQDSLIKRFEFTFELAWKLMKDYAYFQGINNISGSRDAIRFAYSANLINKPEIWFQMIDVRNLSVHTYDRQTAEYIAELIIKSFYNELLLLKQKFSEIYEQYSKDN